MCSVSVQNIISKCTIKCLREKSGLLSSAMHLPPSHPENDGLQSISQHQPQQKHGVAEGETGLQIIPRPNRSRAPRQHTGKPGDGSGSREMLSKGRQETMLRKLQEQAQQLLKDAPQQSQGHRSSHRRSLSHGLAILLQGCLPHGCEHLQELCLRRAVVTAY